MSNTSSKATHLYGLAYQKLQTRLTKQGKYGELRLTTYLSARMNIPTWTFSAPDIVEQTGLRRTAVYKLCQKLERSGIFTVKESARGTATIYNFDKPALLAYLQGELALDELARNPLTAGDDQTVQSSTTTPLNDTPLAVERYTTTPLNDTLPDLSTVTIIKIEKEDEKKDIHTNRAYVCPLTDSTEEPFEPSALTPSLASLARVVQTETELNPADAKLSAKAKADEFIKQARKLQASSPELGAIVKSNAYDKLVNIFTEEPNLTVKELGGEWFDVLNTALSSKICISKDDPLNYAGTKVERGEYDERFWVKRSCDLTFFINNRANVMADLDLNCV